MRLFKLKQLTIIAFISKYILEINSKLRKINC